MKKILLVVTGSVAAKLTPVLVRELQKKGHEVKIVATPSSLYFFHKRILFGKSHLSQALRFIWNHLPASLQKTILGEKKYINAPIYTDVDEFPGHNYNADAPIKHIELRDWANVLLIAPLTANTLAKMAYGFSDNLALSVIRAWNRERPIVIAPAMNTKMWDNPTTVEHLGKIKTLYKVEVVGPVAKKLACGDVGIGAMADIKDIVAAIK